MYVSQVKRLSGVTPYLYGNIRRGYDVHTHILTKRLSGGVSVLSIISSLVSLNLNLRSSRSDVIEVEYYK